VLVTAGRADEAARLADELLERLPGHLLNPGLGVDLPIALIKLDRPAEALNNVVASRWLEATHSFLTGNPQDAADIYAAIGSRPDEADARLEAARQLLAAGAPIEANTELAIALAFYREVGASARIEAARQLMSSMLSPD
jgi:hypothetical protein